VPDEGLRTNCFTIVFKHGDELSFCAYSKEEKEEWIKDLSECSEEAKQKLATHDGTLHTRPRAHTLSCLASHLFFAMSLHRASDPHSQTESISHQDSVE